jgi:hypothetical protein
MRDWYAIVYGRTLHADNWWRVVPGSLSPYGWLGGIVSAAVTNAARLDEPRYLLARSHGYWVTGIACRASVLSDTMNWDGQRPLFTFVGWAADEEAQILPPPLPVLQAGTGSWLRDAYQRGVEPDWERPQRDMRDPRVSAPEVPPWAIDSENPVPAAEPADTALTAEPGLVAAYPDHDAGLVWAAGQATTKPFTLIVGWPTLEIPIPAEVTHVCVIDLEAATIVPSPGHGAVAAAEPAESGPSGAGDPGVAESRPAAARSPRGQAGGPGPWKPFDVLTGPLRRLTRKADHAPAIHYDVRLLIQDSEGEAASAVVFWSPDDRSWKLPSSPVNPGESISATCMDWLEQFTRPTAFDLDPPAELTLRLVERRTEGNDELVTLVFGTVQPVPDLPQPDDRQARLTGVALMPLGDYPDWVTQDDARLLDAMSGQLATGGARFLENLDPEGQAPHHPDAAP